MVLHWNCLDYRFFLFACAYFEVFKICPQISFDDSTQFFEYIFNELNASFGCIPKDFDRVSVYQTYHILNYNMGTSQNYLILPRR